MTESLEYIAADINARLKKAEEYGDKSKQMQISAGRRLLEARPLVQYEGLPWMEWVEDNIVWSYQHAMRCVGYAESSDPDAAVDAFREQTREAMQKHRNIEEPLSRERDSTPSDDEAEVEDILEETKKQSQSGSEKRISRAIKAFTDCREDEREVAFATIRNIVGM